MTGQMKVTRAVGVVSLAALVLAALALTDISHGEADVTLEWHMVQAAFAIVFVFHVLSLRTLR